MVLRSIFSDRLFRDRITHILYMIRLIVNADDLGMNHRVNIAIEKEIREGNISSSTIMANADGFDEAVRLSQNYPQISFGVHLTLDEFRPVTNNRLFYDCGIVDSETGCFVKGKIWQINIDDDLKKAIRQEWSAQIKKVKEAGIPVSHVDSHHHVHTIPALKDILLEVLAENGITKARSCNCGSWKELFHGWRHFNGGSLIKESIYLLLRHQRLNDRRDWICYVGKVIRLTDDFCSVTSFLFNENYYKKYCDNDCIELECHPGHVNYQNETNKLSRLKVYDRVTYNDLK